MTQSLISPVLYIRFLISCTGLVFSTSRQNSGAPSPVTSIGTCFDSLLQCRIILPDARNCSWRSPPWTIHATRSIIQHQKLSKPCKPPKKQREDSVLPVSCSVLNRAKLLPSCTTGPWQPGTAPRLYHKTAIYPGSEDSGGTCGDHKRDTRYGNEMKKKQGRATVRATSSRHTGTKQERI